MSLCGLFTTIILVDIRWYVSVYMRGNDTNIDDVGGFEDGGSASFNGSVIVERALQLDRPVVYVSVNYRYVTFCCTSRGSHCMSGYLVRCTLDENVQTLNVAFFSSRIPRRRRGSAGRSHELGIARSCALPNLMQVDRADGSILIERLGMRWVQKYISAFGGDPSKVTM